VEVFQQLRDAIISGDAGSAGQLAAEALAAGADPEALVYDAMTPGMDEVGRRFEAGEFFLPELLIAARAMKTALEKIRPHLAARPARSAGRAVLGTVAGDQHDIGKNLVCVMLEGAGFQVINLGFDVSPEAFVAAVQDEGPELLGMSALLSTTMPAMKRTIAALKDAGVRDRVKIMIGGAPVTEQFAEEIGADGYAPNASAAVNVARGLVGHAE
jgi:5-methyltetrahydrofolate--homocysteine methyltransferase